MTQFIQIVGIALLLLFVLYLIAYCLVAYEAWIVRPRNVKFKLNTCLIVFNSGFRIALIMSRYNPAFIIYKMLKSIPKTASKINQESLRIDDERQMVMVNAIQNQPGANVLLIISELMGHEAFANFGHRFEWIIPAIFPWKPDDVYRTKCPFELNPVQYRVAVEVYMKWVERGTASLNEIIAPVVLEPMACDNSTVYAAYKELGVAEFIPSSGQPTYCLSEWNNHHVGHTS